MKSLLRDLVVQFEPYWTGFNTSGASAFGNTPVKRGEKVSEVLFSVTNARAAVSERPVILKTYRTVRREAAKHIVAALPHIGSRVQGTRPDPSTDRRLRAISRERDRSNSSFH